MKTTLKKTIYLAIALLLSACIGAPVVNFADKDSTCAQQCSANHTTCMSGFKLFPLANEQSCKTAMETCAKTCPSKADAATASNAKPQTATVSERLKQLDQLLKDGLITKSEHETKRQEILKSI